MTEQFDYEELGLVAGLEIHQQLDTATKLFCECPTVRRDPDDAMRSFTRYLHPTRSELGEIDAAALEESRVDREFEYLSYDTTCLVEEDDEPPGRLDAEALSVTLEIAALLDVDVVDEAQVMRKVVIDGSNTAGFQRSALIGTDGGIETDAGSIGIEDVMLEEESAARLEETEDGVRFGLDRLGIPLVEIGTEPDIETAEQARAAAERIGMILRSTGQVKRGLGTIRQDVNVSIEDGARVELKGVQSLDEIDDIVRLEVQRQVELLDIADELQQRDASVHEPQDVTTVFESTESDVIAGVLDTGGTVLAVRLAGFDGVVGRELQPDRRLGTEFSDHASRHGAGGVFHTDELPGYGVSAEEVTALRESVDATEDDAVVFVAARDSIVEQAIEAVADRARTALDGVPEETRDALEGGTTRYLRPLPGAARMYPETDVPPVEPDVSEVEVPPLLTERVDQYVDDHGLNPELAEQVAYGERMPLYELGVELGVDPPLAARMVESTYTSLRRDDVPIDELSRTRWREAFELVAAGEIAQEGVPTLLETMVREDVSAREGVDIAGLGSVGEDAVKEVVQAVVDRNEGQVQEEGMGAFSALMGECMGELRGQADGDLVSQVLREEITARTGD